MIIETCWSEIKRLCTDKGISVQWVFDDPDYHVYCIDGNFALHSILLTGTSEQTEFLATYKTTIAKRVSSPMTALTNPEDYRFRGTATAWTECLPGVTTNIDITPSTTEDRFVDGGYIIHKDSNPGDKVAFKVVHPTYGVVETYVPGWLLPPGTGSEAITVYPAKIPPNIILRVSYTNTGTTSAFCGVNYRLHRKGAGA